MLLEIVVLVVTIKMRLVLLWLVLINNVFVYCYLATYGSYFISLDDAPDGIVLEGAFNNIHDLLEVALITMVRKKTHMHARTRASTHTQG